MRRCQMTRNQLGTFAVASVLVALVLVSSLAFSVMGIAASLGDLTGSADWQVSYAAGTWDAAGNYMGGTETMNLVAHKGRLYAGVGYWMDLPYSRSKGDEPWTGAQILVKDSSNSDWRVEHNLGASSLRVDALRSVTFTTDSNGDRLSEPVSMLVASSTDFVNKGLWIWSHNDEASSWRKVKVSESEKPLYGRSFGQHKDRVTGVDCVFVGTSTGQIFRGSYDPNLPSGIRWQDSPELLGEDGRAMAFTVANGILYASVSDNLYMRNDGPNPSWSSVYHWEPISKTREKVMRGLTTISNPEGIGEIILGAREEAGVIERIDPSKNHAVTVELEIVAFARQRLGPEVSGLIAAYNDMCKAKDPKTGKSVLMMGLGIFLRKSASTGLGTSTWYLIRSEEGKYDLREVPAIPDSRRSNPALYAVRTIAVSPFVSDAGLVIYAGGYDTIGQPCHDTAWIYRISMQTSRTVDSPSMSETAASTLMPTQITRQPSGLLAAILALSTITALAAVGILRRSARQAANVS